MTEAVHPRSVEALKRIAARARARVDAARMQRNAIRSLLARVSVVLPSVADEMRNALAGLQIEHVSLLSDLNEITSEFSGSAAPVAAVLALESIDQTDLTDRTDLLPLRYSGKDLASGVSIYHGEGQD